MPIRYTSADALEYGVPLGGIGCGALQVYPDGTRGQFTGLNNWHHPLGQLHWFRNGSGADYRVSNPFAIFVKQGERRIAKLLQTQPVANLPVVRALRLEADFPIVELAVEDAELPVQVSATIFSGYLPRAYRLSGVPGVLYQWRIHNPGPAPATVALLCCAVNAVGPWNVSRYNTVVQRDGYVGILFQRRHAQPGDEQQGTLALLTRARGAEVSYWGSWMYAAAPFGGEQEDRRLDAWAPFARQGRLPNDGAVREAFGECDEPMGALALRTELAAGGTVTWSVSYSWHMPHHALGHRYAGSFATAWEAGRYLHRYERQILRRTRAWQDTIRRAPWPEWLSDGLINSLCVYSAASWWTRTGAYAIFENPVKWPLMDSLDVRYYGTLALALLFPRLERATMELFRSLQRPDGRIPHDLGKSQLNCPSDGTTAGLPWKDLSTKYALMVYRDFLWSGDRTWVRRFYPSVKRAMVWQLATDKNGDGLPENEGRDTTYDLWDFFGTGSYTASLHLAALRATEALARAAGDWRFAGTCRAQCARGARSFDEQLWTGTYYRAARRLDGRTYDACIAGQLNGQWYAHLLGLGYLLPPERVRQAVQTMLRLNGGASRFGAVNAVFPDGRPDEGSYHAGNVWVGETYALAALAVYEGFIDEGLELARRAWLTFVDHAKRPWSQTDVVAAADGQLGDGEFYLRNVAIWALPLALARHDPGAQRALTRLAPTLPAARQRRRPENAGVGPRSGSTQRASAGSAGPGDHAARRGIVEHVV